MAGHTEAGNRLVHCLKKASTAQELDRAEKAPAATDFVKTDTAIQERTITYDY